MSNTLEPSAAASSSSTAAREATIGSATLSDAPPPRGDTSAFSSSHPHPPLATTITPALSAQLRLETLSYLIHGHTKPSASSSSSSSTNAQPNSVLIRLSEALSSLEAVKKIAGKPLTRFLEDWDRNADLLHPLSQHSTVPRDGEGGMWDANQQSTYLLSQQTELIEAMKSLERVENLVEQHGVLDAEKSRKLARAIDESNNKTRLNSLKAESEQEAKRAKATQDKVLALVHGWSTYTSTLSQAFTLLDSQLLTLERQIKALERQQQEGMLT